MKLFFTFSWKIQLSLQSFKDNLEKEMDTLQAIRDKMIEAEKKTVELEQKWNELLPDLMEVIKEMAQGEIIRTVNIVSDNIFNFQPHKIRLNHM